MFDQIDSALVMQPEIIKQAQLAVCMQATDTEDARILLDMLGLAEDPVRFPSWGMTDRGVRRAPSSPPAAPLPSSGYGAVPVAPPA